MELAHIRLDDEQIAAALTELEGWSVESGNLAKTFVFDRYPEGPEFAVKVGQIAEELNHHPDIHIGYRKVRIAVHTHDVGGLSPYDFELAKRIDAI
ncbi:MAG: 4a-hydroxytetrahydrobiopterin dehydratase [Fimbriimonadaceae bacterium]